MTPLITEIAALHTSPEEFNWIDCAHVRIERWDDQLLNLDKLNDFLSDHLPFLPFEKTALVLTISETKFGLFIYKKSDAFFCYAIIKVRSGKTEVLESFFYKISEESGKIFSYDPKRKIFSQPNDDILFRMSLIAICLIEINDSTIAYSINKTDKSKNARRIAKGKKPLYEWRTLEIKPPAPKSASLGGTHASPRQHDRRGHWRQYKSGKRVWVRNAKVGKASIGTVFHDYKVKAVEMEAAR